MKIAICEDSPEDIKTLKQKISAAIFELHLDIEADYYSSGEELIEAVSSQQAYPLILLDIYMKNLNGIQTAHKIRDLLPDVQFAFLTTSQEFMLEAFDLNALHYIIKPIETQKIKECFERFCERSKIPPVMLEIKSEYKTYTFPRTHIQKIVSRNKGIDVFLQKSPPVHIPISFIKAEKQLDSDFFLKISRGFIVQMAFILCIDKNICRLKDGTEILISRQSTASIRKKYNDYLFHFM